MLALQEVVHNGGAADLTRITYVVDTRYEGSSPEHTKGAHRVVRPQVATKGPCTDALALELIFCGLCAAAHALAGPYWTPIIPWFQSNVLNQSYAKEWKGLMGSPGRVPPEADALASLEGATSLLWLGLGRFFSYVPPNVSQGARAVVAVATAQALQPICVLACVCMPLQVVSSLDLRGCDVAILLGRVNNEVAHQKQVYIDNRKSATERALEQHVRTAELLLARGVKTVVTGSMATTAAANTAALQAILAGLASGLTVSEAVWKASLTLQAELDHQKCTFFVLGAPNLTASAAGGKGGKAGAAAPKKK